jgi:hypothetical protein
VSAVKNVAFFHDSKTLLSHHNETLVVGDGNGSVNLWRGAEDGEMTTYKTERWDAGVDEYTKGLDALPGKTSWDTDRLRIWREAVRSGEDVITQLVKARGQDAYCHIAQGAKSSFGTRLMGSFATNSRDILPSRAIATKEWPSDVSLSWPIVTSQNLTMLSFFCLLA